MRRNIKSSLNSYGMKKFFFLTGILITLQSLNAQWVNTNGPPGGGHVGALIVFGENILAATDESGIFLSTDVGTSWEQVKYNFTGTIVRQFIIAGDYILAGTDYGIYRSSDGGYNWTEANVGMPAYRSVLAMALNGATIIVFTSSGSYFVSDNYGETWLGVSLAQTGTTALAVCNDYLFAGCYSGVRRSSDNGATWIEVSNGLTDLSVQAVAVIDSTLIAGTYQGTLFTSKDSGLSWTKVKQGLAEITDLTVSGSLLYVVSGSGLFRSADYGATLTSINNGLPGTLPVISLAASGVSLYAGLDGGGVYYSGYGGNSWRATSGLPCTVVKSLAASNSTIFAGTIGHGLFRSTDDGNEWEKTGNEIPDWVSIVALATKGTTVFAGTSDGLYRSTDDGVTWSISLAGPQVQSFATTPTTIFSGVYYGGIYTSTDNGINWSQINNGLPVRPVNAIAVKGTTLFAGTEGNGVYRSMDNGNSWIPVNSGLTNQIIFSLVVNGTTIFAGTDGGLFKTDNNGSLWTQVEYGRINSLALYDSTLFAGTYSGAYISANNGETWAAANEGLIGLINSFAFKGTNVFAATSGSGVFINQALLTRTEDEVEGVPQICIYPNPAKNTITCEPPEYLTGRLLSVYNVNGREVLRQLITEQLTNIDISILPAGWYVMRYDNGMTIRTGKFIKE